LTCSDERCSAACEGDIETPENAKAKTAPVIRNGLKNTIVTSVFALKRRMTAN
jgi:hypothetical protein